MKYILLLISAIALMIASCQSGMLNVNAISAKDIREQLQGIDEDQLLSAFESLKSGEADNEWLQGIDENQILRAFGSLKSGGVNNNNQWLQGIDEDQILRAQDGLGHLRGLSGLGTDDGGGYGGAFVLILVLFILLVIIGAGFGFGDGLGDDKNRELSADVQNAGYIPLMTMER